ncbi:TKL/DICTY4/DRK protein kinase [Salpingoeca rosetta]|uniref:TKL/DICTY4/DRK protein kinase n=1 Tax=Salpingoeca rosetta (strain ATCC 50818 / BSB-021) TaxID=946362 RepID=F2URU7_SALR5|nr:TKL/DICTY4/DRK protein kinase [Salpingoeca rosetta]EGD80352.1 TKL/DICTY4/DRK protein kinase [Salpingoeca rosetta]|eukprot:XP_004988142.1 TKL/DICTY4/DRK protein kinase [Salpingoeca rosetta]
MHRGLAPPGVLTPTFAVRVLLVLVLCSCCCSPASAQQELSVGNINNVFRAVPASGIVPPASTFHATAVLKLDTTSAFNRQASGDEEVMVLFGGYELNDIRYSTRNALNTTYLFSARTPPVWIDCQAPVAPQGRAFHVMETLTAADGNERVVLHGGLAGDLQTHFASTWVLDIAGNQCEWQEIETSGSPGQRAAHGSAEVNDRMYVFGGCRQFVAQRRALLVLCEVESLLNDLWQFDLLTRTWTEIPLMGDAFPPPRSSPMLAVVNATVSPAPRPRARHLAHLVDVDGQAAMVVYGGFVHGQIRGLRSLGDMWAFYPDNSTWEDWTPRPINASLSQGLFSLDSIGEAGGVLEYNVTTVGGGVATLMWPQRRSSVCLFGSRQKFVFFGGNTEGFDLAEAWEYDVAVRRWMLLDTEPGSGLLQRQLARSGHSCLLIDDPNEGSRALVFGGEGASRLNNDVVVFRPTCNYGTGASGAFFINSCRQCAQGTFSTAITSDNPDDDSQACESCPFLTTTPGDGAKTVEECSICAPNACEGKRSTCVVQAANGRPTYTCQCAFGRSGTRCEVQWGLGVLLGVLLALLLAVVIFFVVRWYRSEVNEIKHISEHQAKELELTGHELHELRRVFEIPYTQVDKRNRIDKECEGNFGAVYFGYYSGRPVAIKMLKETLTSCRDPLAREDFQREVKVMRELRDANIVFFYGAGYEPDGTPFLVTEYMARGSLQQIILNPTERLDWRLRYRFALDAAQGMLFLHSKTPPLLHRDLKSANLLVAEDWTVKVADFGTARLSEHLTGVSAEEQDYQQSLLHSQSEGAVGTICWCAPEVLSDEHYSLPSDVYSFGIVMFEIASREEPFKELKSYAQVKGAVLRGQRPALPSNCPVKFGLLMQQCWNQDPYARPQFYQVRKRLLEMLEGEP